MNEAIHANLRTYAAWRWPSLTHGARIWRLSGELGWRERRTRALYNNEIGMRVRADEAAQVEALKKEKRHDEYRDLEARIAALEALFAVGDEEHGRPHVEALRAFLNRQGG